jgi:2-(1,2-epoxy-1,2-dihydrophenyl)acetyl-CoA isomerase
VSETFVRYEVRDGVAVVTLDRPDRLNALVVEMREALGTHFEQAGRDPAVRAVLLQAAGRAFCASGDVSRMAEFTPESGRATLKIAQRMIRNLAAIEKPVIAAVRGAVAGIGMSLAMACDLVIASDTARFSQVFRNVGLVPDGGAIWFLTQHLGTLRAKELVFSGRRIDAAEAHALGLVTRVVPDAELDTIAWELAKEYATGPTVALGMAKKMFRLMHSPDLETLLDAEAWAQGQAFTTEDHKEGVQAFLAKRPPQFKGR